MQLKGANRLRRFVVLAGSAEFLEIYPPSPL